MARRSKPFLTFLLDACSRLGLPSGLAIAALIFLLLRWVAGHAPATGIPGEFSSPTVIWQIGTQASVVLQWLVPAFIVTAVVAAAIRRRRQNALLSDVQKSGASQLGAMSWRQFEEMLAGYFRGQGYAVVTNIAKGPDGGVDLRLKRDGDLYLVQCKHWRSRKVPVTTVRELFGVMAAEGSTGGFVITSGAFSAEARDFAHGREIQLIDGEGLRQILALSSPGSNANSVEPRSKAGPGCPICGEPMVRRIARRGPTAGSEFWGCTEYPACRGTRPIQ